MYMEPEIIEIGNDSTTAPMKLNLGSMGGSSSSSSSIPGIELLMNDKKGSMKSSSSGDDGIHVDDLANLESELNDLTTSLPGGNDITPRVNFATSDESGKTEIKLDEIPTINTPSVGEYTSDAMEKDKTWDGFGTFQNIPIDPDQNVTPTPQLSKEEMLREKFKFLRKLDLLEKKGVELTKKYTMESSLSEMMGEYEMIVAEKEKENSVKFQGNMLAAFINGVEFLNGRFDPFDVKLDGWGEQFNENITDYDEIFGELHEKYKSKEKMAPEIKLIFQLAASGMMVHMTNTMFKSAMPNMDDIMRQNPDLMQQFGQAAASTMGKTNPGFSGFMGNMMSPNEPPKSVHMGPPPAAIQTKTQKMESMPPPRAPSFQEPPGANMFSNSQNNNDGINVDQNYASVGQQERSLRRPEMKGPSDISNILSGLKPKTPAPQPVTRTISTSEGKVNPFSETPVDLRVQKASMDQNELKDAKEEIGSTISISELKELQNENMPKRSKRRQKSDKNTVSLDI